MTILNTPRLLRGGSWGNFPGSSPSACRYRRWPDVAVRDVGFRVVCLRPGGNTMTAFDSPRLLRGGSWIFYPGSYDSAFRYPFRCVGAFSFIGFRVVCLPREVAPCRMALRGASWDFISVHCRSAYRFRHWPVNASSYFGFRVVCLPREITP
jgi:formylglycine-generating enzyme required for sulfatase activity